MSPELAQNAIYIIFGVAVFLGVEATYMAIAKRSSYVRKVNSRLMLLDTAQDQHDVLVQLRRDRGLTSEGRYRLPIIWFNQLVLQSGLRMGIWKLAGVMAIMAVAASVATLIMDFDWLLAIPAAFAGGIGVPVIVLRYLRQRRRSLFEEQLPEAVDIMVRSLKAGHPLPVAISMVGREMPDPIGTEFGLTTDELTYGLDLETAMHQMSARVGQDDFSLVVTAISIQSKTGGNLSELLANLSKVLRDRFKMRRRVRAVSAEGRMSAIGLSALPAIVFVLLQIFAPEFYGGIWNEPAVLHGLGGAVVMMMIGNIIMMRMVNFKL
ncbi:MAG: type II secretion system F family protein [Alphaproteobacteria bacterium]